LAYFCITFNKTNMAMNKKLQKWIMVFVMGTMVITANAQDDFPPDFGGNMTDMPGDMNGKPGDGPGDESTQMGSVSKTGYQQTKGTKKWEGKTFTSAGTDENAVQVTGGKLTLTQTKVTKTGGDTENTDGSSFYGTNSAVYVSGNHTVVNMTGGEITTNAKGCNAGFAYDGGTLNLTDTKIHCTNNLSRGIHATGGGIINANNLTILTEGNNSSVIATDRGGGTVTVKGGNYTAAGADCAVLYSTGNITVDGITGVSKQGEIGVIEGDNSIHINNSDMTSGDKRWGMMILQSGSGDSHGYNGKITVNHSKLTLTDPNAPLCEVPTNITGTVTLNDAELNVPSKILMRVEYYKRWHTKGGTGNLILKTDSEKTYEGTVVKDEYGILNVTVGKGVTWILTADAAIDKLTVEPGGIIKTNGNHITYLTADNHGQIIE
jgi:hypothetical protein